MKPSSKCETFVEPRTDPSVGAAERALDILELLEDADRAPSLTQIGVTLGLPRASTHRLLTTLRRRGYVRQEHARGGYSLGLRLLPLAARSRGRLTLVAIAEPALRALADATGESCQISIRSGLQAVCVARVSSPNHPDLSLAGQIGSVFPLHAVAVGKALLAFAPATERDIYLAGPLDAYTPVTKTTADRLSPELAEIRETCIARDDEEFKRGLSAIAAPVFGFEGSVEAAIALPFLTGLPDADRDRYETALRSAADSLSSELGYGGDRRRVPRSQKQEVGKR